MPPVALLLGWAMHGDVPPPLGLPGGVLSLLGVVLARLAPPTVTPEGAQVV